MIKILASKSQRIDWKKIRNFILNEKRGTHIHDTAVGNLVKCTLSQEAITDIKKKTKLAKLKCSFLELEELIVELIKEQRGKNLVLTQIATQKPTLLIFENMNKDNSDLLQTLREKYSQVKFFSSNGQFQRFKRRTNLSRIIPVSQKLLMIPLKWCQSFQRL